MLLKVRKFLVERRSPDCPVVRRSRATEERKTSRENASDLRASLDESRCVLPPLVDPDGAMERGI